MINPADFSFSNFARQRRYLLLSMVSWFVMVVLAFAVVIPQIQSIFAVQNKTTQDAKVLAELQNKHQFLSSFNIDQFRQQNDRVTAILPSIKPFLPLLHSLQQLSIQQNVVFSGLDWNVGLVSASDSASTAVQGQTKVQPQPTTADGMARLNLDLKILGTSPQVNGFLDAIVHIAPIVDVNDVALTPKFQIGEGVYEASLKLTGYFVPLSSLKVSNTGDKPLPKLSDEERTYIDQLSAYSLFQEQGGTASSSAEPLGKENLFSL